ncbi:MAG: hypothetical protein ACFE9T_01330 [Promethearchaeota archaeon]
MNGANTLISILKKYWFYLSLIPIIILYFFNSTLAIVLIIIFIFSLIIYYFIFFNFKKKILRFVKDFKIIEDRAIAQELNYSLQQVKTTMKKLIQKQDKKQWVIISINKNYIFFNDNVINDFIGLYKQGMNEKEIYEALNREEEVFKSRREIKLLEDELIRQHKIFRRKKRGIEDRVTSELMD